jgi:hypothetical protein
MVSREAEPASRIAGRVGGTGGLGAGEGGGLAAATRCGFWAVARDLVAIFFTPFAPFPGVRPAGRFALVGGGLAFARFAGAPLAGALTRAGLFGGRLEELTPELPDPADWVRHGLQGHDPRVRR